MIRKFPKQILQGLITSNQAMVNFAIIITQYYNKKQVVFLMTKATKKSLVIQNHTNIVLRILVFGPL